MNATLAELFGSLNYSNNRVMHIPSIKAIGVNNIWRMGWVFSLRNSGDLRVPRESEAAYPFKEEPDIR